MPTLTDEIKSAVLQVLKEELPSMAHAYAAKKPVSVRTDLRDTAITDFLSALTDLEASFSTLTVSLEKIKSEYGVEDAAKDAYPFSDSIDEMYKKVIHWSAAQTEVLTNRYLNGK